MQLALCERKAVGGASTVRGSGEVASEDSGLNRTCSMRLRMCFTIRVNRYRKGEPDAAGYGSTVG